MEDYPYSSNYKFYTSKNPSLYYTSPMIEIASREIAGRAVALWGAWKLKKNNNLKKKINKIYPIGATMYDNLF